MELRVALNKTIKFCELKAVDLAKASGVDQFEISKYRRGHKDMGSANLSKVIDSLPLSAKVYFSHLLIFGEDADFETQNATGKPDKPNCKTSEVAGCKVF